MRYTALYSRVSSTNGKQATGAESQILALKTYCQSKGISNFKIYSDEISGVKASRPALDQLIRDVESGAVEKVVSYSLSRLSRSVAHLLMTLEKLQDHNTGFESLTESISLQGPTGRLMITILGAVAELERSLIVERTKCGLANAKAKGKVLGRRKTRNSDLIQELLGKGYPYRKIAKLAKCSVWCVGEEAKVLNVRKIHDGELPDKNAG